MPMVSKPDGTAATASVPERFQFRIRDLLIVMVLAGLFAGGVFEPNPWLLGAGFVATLACLLFLWRFQLWHLLLIVALAGIAILLCLPTLDHPQWVWRRAYCGNKLRTIGIALHTYHDVHKSLPPAYITDERGQPMHSWRVLLLPYLEQQALYERYDFNEPWNGPNNRLLAAEIAKVYSCTERPQSAKYETNYMAVIGAGTPWPGAHSRSFIEFQDGTSSVILLVEVPKSGIHCMEPRDLDLSQFVPQVNPTKGTGISSQHPAHRTMRHTTYGAHVLVADGTVRFLDRNADPKAIESMLRIDDGTVKFKE